MFRSLPKYRIREQQWTDYLTGFVLICGLLLIGCNPSVDVSPKQSETVSGSSALVEPVSNWEPGVRQKIEQFCGDCHAMPIPSTFPKASWPEEVRQGFAFYIDSGRTDLPEPKRADVVRYFQESAPDQVVVPRADEVPQESTSLQFVKGPSNLDGSSSVAIAHLNWNEDRRDMLVTEMHAGAVWRWRPESNQLARIATGRNICRVTRCDWNSDGLEDLITGEMGSFPVGDHNNGRVSLLIAKVDGSYEPLVIADGLSRVVEAVPLDFDEDGDLDVVVADFGWRKTGGLKLLRNTSADQAQPKFNVEVLDDRHGALGVQIQDMNGDGRPDLVVAFGQEFESVEVYYNRSPRAWDHQVVYRLPDPSYNASAFQIADIDKNGSLDIVLTCGDTMDALIPKPYHGVHCLKNVGDEKFEDIDLGLLVGALQATVADFDNDGDMDIAAIGLYPESYRDPGAYDSIVWWEQRDNLTFVRHSIQRDDCSHACCTAADIDGDGRIDLIVGDWLRPDSTGFHVFFNRPAK